MEDNTVKILIIAEAKKVFEKYNAIFPNSKINFSDINMKFSLRGKTAGTACYSYRQLNFNLILAKENLAAFIARTVSHEIAHLYQSKMYPNSKDHGAEWKKIMILGGYNPVRCHSYDLSPIYKDKVTFLYTCKCGQEFHISKLLHGRIQKGSDRCCRKCKGRIFLK